MTSQDDSRPDPEELLRKIQAQEALKERGRLKVFLGYAPRVGKSLRMFEEGARRKIRGQDVVVGAIQTQGMEALAHLTGQFEIVTGLDAILKRHPQVCLVDELARDNPAGSRHEHRWQDVEELCEHGINVVCAINLQHISEQQEAVERITGGRAAHSVPRGFIEGADEIVIVDVPPCDLKENPVEPRKLTPTQLSELRELALLLAAEVVEHQLQRYLDGHGIAQSGGTQERILVCVTSRGNAREMLESGARSAERFHGQLFAVTVRTGEPVRADAEALETTLDLARKLGATVYILEGTDAVAEIIRFAREQRITQLFIGHTQKSAWKIWAKSHVDKLIEAAEGMDVRVFPQSDTKAA